MKEREELITPHALINIKKKHIKICVFLWWTIKGLSRCLKKMQAFSEPLQDSRARQSKNKGIHKGCLYFWWTIRGLSRCSKKMQAFSEPFHGFSSQSKAKKKHPERGAFSLVDDQGAFALLKENASIFRTLSRVLVPI